MPKSNKLQPRFTRTQALKWLQAYWRRLLLVAVLGLVGIIIYSRTTALPQGLETYTVSQTQLVDSIPANGNIKAHQHAQVSFNLPSKVSWVGVKKGDRVAKWQALATLDQRLLEKDLSTALSNYLTTRWDFDTTHQDTYKDQLITNVIQRELDKSQFTLDRSVISVEIADIAKKEAVLLSPIAGTVTNTHNLLPGANLIASDLAAKTIDIVDFDSLYFEAQVDEVDYAQVSLGQSVEIDLDAYPGQTCQGEVADIGSVGEETSGGVVTIPVEVNFTECDLSLALGLNGEARFAVQSLDNVLVIPKKYLVSQNGTDQVWVQTGTSPQKRQLKPVTVGLATTTQAQILDGLEVSDTILFIPTQ